MTAKSYINWSELSELDHNHLSIMAQLALLPNDAFPEVESGLERDYDKLDSSVLRRLETFRQGMETVGFNPKAPWPDSERMSSILSGLEAMPHAESAKKVAVFVEERMGRTFRISSHQSVWKHFARQYLFWDASQHTEQENVRYSYLRAIEWGRWPLFLSQLFAPAALLFIDWKIVAVSVFVANIAWAFVRYRFISFKVADVAVLLMMLKMPLWIGSVLILWFTHRHSLAILSVCWFPVIFIMGAFTPAQTGFIQQRFLLQMLKRDSAFAYSQGGAP